MSNLTESVATPSRSLSLDGTSNFRDLGGYATVDGRQVKWRRLFRSDHLARLSAADLRWLQELGVTHAVDFRGHSERATHAYDWPQWAQHAFTVEPVVVHRTQQLMQSGHRLTAEEAVGLMQETYDSFVRDNATQFAQLFALMLGTREPLVFHCTAGKDRTGWAAALILLALGVPRDVVMHDYLLSNSLYKRPSYAIPALQSGRLAPEVLDVLWGVQQGFLSQTLDRIHRDHGGLDRYLAEVLGVDAAAREQLQRRYLE